MNSVSRIGGNWVLQINECIIWTNVKAIGAQPTFYIVKWSQCDLNVDRRSTVTGIRNCQASNDWRCVEVANKKGVHPCFLFGIYSTGKYGELFGAAPYFLSASSDKIRNPDLNLATMHLQRWRAPWWDCALLNDVGFQKKRLQLWLWLLPMWFHFSWFPNLMFSTFCF